jgi:hypothetical protein
MAHLSDRKPMVGRPGSPFMEKHPQELRWEAQRLLLEANRVTDEAQRKLMRARALELAAKAELLAKQPSSA